MSQPKPQSDRDPFDLFAVYLVAELASPGADNYCERIESRGQYAALKESEEVIGWFYTVYGFREDRGSVAVSDFGPVDFVGSVADDKARKAATDLAFALARSKHAGVIDESRPSA